MRKRGRPQRFERTGLLAIDPKAFFELFFDAPLGRENERRGDVEVIEITGPLVQRDDTWTDSYESIRERVQLACEGDARAIVLRFDSPGGDASGCFETARAIREAAALAGKPLLAYIDRACSAAYALATSASVIAIGETCCAGSVGVMSSRADFTAQNNARGLRMAFVTSGERKLDGNPDSPITEIELEETRKHVNDLAAKFFDLIERQRPQLPAATVESFDGGVFYGEGAVKAGLADVVTTFDQLIANATEKNIMTILSAKAAASDYDSARASLEKAAKGTDANAAAAKRALAAMAEAAPAAEDDDEEKPDAEGDEEKPDAAGETPPPAAASDDEPPADKKPPAASAAQAAGLSPELALAAKVHKLEAKEADRERTALRRQLIAKRPDFSPELKAALMKAPISTVREMIKTLPKGTIPTKPKAITTVGATRGDTQLDAPDGAASARSGADAKELDRAMGFTAQKLGCRREGSTLYFGVMADDKKPAAGPASA